MAAFVWPGPYLDAVANGVFSSTLMPPHHLPSPLPFVYLSPVFPRGYDGNSGPHQFGHPREVQRRVRCFRRHDGAEAAATGL